jgi:hypothetical protein
MHTMVTEFHQIGPLISPEPSAPADPDDDQRPGERLLLQVNTFLVEHRWSPDVVRVQFVVTPLPGGCDALHQILVTHPAVTT